MNMNRRNALSVTGTLWVMSLGLGYMYYQMMAQHEVYGMLAPMMILTNIVTPILFFTVLFRKE